MRFFEMLFVLAVLAMIFGFAMAMARAKQKGRANEAVAESLSTQTAARLADLEERVRVLERIVTDERTDLRRQFKDL